MKKFGLILLGIWFFIIDLLLESIRHNKFFRLVVSYAVMTALALSAFWVTGTLTGKALEYFNINVTHSSYTKERVQLYKDGYPPIFCMGAEGGVKEFKVNDYKIFKTDENGWLLSSKDGSNSFHFSRCQRQTIEAKVTPNKGDTK